MYSISWLHLLYLALAISAKHGEGESQNLVNATTSTPTTSTIKSPSSSPSTSTSSSSAPLPSTSGGFQLAQPGNLTTCQPAQFSWNYTISPTVTMTIMVTNERATLPVARRNDGDGDADDTLVSRVLSNNITASAGSISWPAVDVVEGPYSVVAFDTQGALKLFAHSHTFFVNNGTDTTCVDTDDGESDSSGTAIPTESGESSSPTALPAPSDSKSLSTGALVGTIAGVFVGVAGIVAAFTIPRLWRHGLTPMRRPGGPYHLF